MGSSVPQCPTFLISSLRRISATTSCDVMPSALSTSKTPSGVAANDITNCLQNSLFDFSERTAHACTCRQSMSTAAEFLTDRAHVCLFTLRTHAHTHFAVGQFFKKDGDNNSADGAEMIDQAFIVFGKNAELGRGFQTQAKTCDATSAFKAHGAQQLAEQFNPAPRIVLIDLLVDSPNIDTGAHELGRDLKGSRGGVWILKRSSVGRDRDVKIFRDRAIERQALAFDQLEKNLSGRGRGWIDINQVAIAWIARVVINVDPNFRRTNCLE